MLSLSVMRSYQNSSHRVVYDLSQLRNGWYLRYSRLVKHPLSEPSSAVAVFLFLPTVCLSESVSESVK
jgi:hypothetical protein